MQPPISTVLLDAGNTLLFATPPVDVRYAEAGQRHGVEVTPAQIKTVYEPLWRQFKGQRAQTLFRTTPAKTRDFWRMFVAAIFAPWRDRIDDFEAMFNELYDGFAASSAWRLVDDVEPSLDRLRRHGLRLAVVSNWDYRLNRILDERGIGTHFDAVLISADEGFEKPSTELFGRALERLSVAPQQALHVGDNLVEDVRGALDAGLHAAHLVRDADRASSYRREIGPDAGYLVVTSLAELADSLCTKPWQRK
jgi:putative hydrolase of the HAD superfamily